MKILVLVLLINLLSFYHGACQIGGNGTYRFLDLTNSAKVAALGGTQIAFTDHDLDLSFYNPSILSDSMKNQLSINYVNYIAGIGVGYVVFAPDIKGRNTFAAGIHYVNYGTFEGASETGQATGNFSAAEYAFNLYYSRTLSSQLRLGINIKPILSSFESYQSVGLAADLGVTYLMKDKRTAVAFVARNLGSQIKTYYQNGDHEKLPWDIQLGFSRRLANAPIKFLATLTHLNSWDITYKDIAEDVSQNAVNPENFTSTMMRHVILGAEIYPEQHVTLRFGYNYRRQKELAVDSRPGLVGFSSGLGVKFSKFNISYAIASFHLAATVHYFSLTTNLSQFIH